MKISFSSVNVFEKQLVSVTSKPVTIRWDKRTIVGAPKLDLAIL